MSSATASGQRPSYDLSALRARIPMLRASIPMNACSQGPQMLDTRDAANAFLDSWATRGMDWEAWIGEVMRAKSVFARLIGASDDEIAVTSSVSEATSSIASAIDFSGTRRNVAVTRAEFPSVGHIWLAQEKRGARVRWIDERNGILSLDDYERVIDDDTALVSATSAYFLNGFKQDLAAIATIAHAHGALLSVDAYQSLGTAPLDVKALGVDILASGVLKFLMGTAGIAFLYVRRELVERLEPTITGWFGRVNPFGFGVSTLDWAKEARRFETGTPPLVNAYIARAGMEVIEACGLASVGDWNTILSRRLVDGGRARGLTLHGTDDSARKAPTTAFLCDDSHAVEQRMRERGVIASARGPVMRLAPHFYSTLDDCDRALDALVASVEDQAR
ncbi:MAG: aminotransferase class V-fold PLP-dependent enzyme [Gemmatimonadaceae bacterium]